MKRLRPCHGAVSRLLAGLLLLVFTLGQGILARGYMPAPLATGIPISLCAGDRHSTQILALVARGQHKHHQVPKQGLSATDCPYATCGTSVVFGLVLAVSTGSYTGLPTLPSYRQPVLNPAPHLRPPGRAPPALARHFNS
jgi:hypothetical protein